MDSFSFAVAGKRVAVLCSLAPKPILLDVLEVDESARMMKVRTVKPNGEEGREWWLSLSAAVTVVVIPKEPNLVQSVQSGVVLF